MHYCLQVERPKITECNFFNVGTVSGIFFMYYILASMGVFALWPVIFWKYVFILFKYVVFLKNMFSYFKKSYFNVSTSKYVHKLGRFYTY